MRNSYDYYQEMILTKPLVAVAGVVDSHSSRVLYVHEGYNPEYTFLLSNRLDEGFYHVWGSLDNPGFSWPVYLLIKRKHIDSSN